jgi:phosphohistidine phosphatase
MTVAKSQPNTEDAESPPYKMRLYLMRHGIAIDREHPDCPEDAQRYLTERGIDRTRSAAHGLAELGVQPAALLSSPYLRAMQTGEIVCEALDIDTKQLRTTDALKPNAEPSRLAAELSRMPEEEVICFGHAPHLDDFIAQAVRAGAAFTALKKAGAACLEVESFSPLKAKLAWLLTSKALRSLGG